MEESSRCSSLASLSPTVSCSNSPGASARRGSGGPTGASPARTAGLPGLEQADRARRRSSREPRPARAPRCPNPSVQADLAARARLPRPICAPRMAAIPLFKPDPARAWKLLFGRGKQGSCRRLDRDRAGRGGTRVGLGSRTRSIAAKWGIELPAPTDADAQARRWRRPARRREPSPRLV